MLFTTVVTSSAGVLASWNSAETDTNSCAVGRFAGADVEIPDPAKISASSSRSDKLT